MFRCGFLKGLLSTKSKLVICSLLFAALPRAPLFRIGLNALIANDRVDSFRFDDENFWFYASEYVRGQLGFIDYVFYPINGNVMVLPRLLFLLWQSDDWIETRFILGTLPGSAAIALTVYLLMNIVLAVGNPLPSTLAIGLLFAYSLHSQEFFAGLAMNGFYLFLAPLLVWLLWKQTRSSPLGNVSIAAIAVLPLFQEPKQLILILLIGLATSLVVTSSKVVTYRMTVATSGAILASIILLGSAMIFGKPGITLSQTDYAEYPSVPPMHGVWIGLQSHALHIFWLWTNSRSDTFVTLAGDDPIPASGSLVLYLLLVVLALLISAFAIQGHIRSPQAVLPKLQVLAFSIVCITAYSVATAVGRGGSGWDWNTPRYSPFAAIIAVLLLALFLQVSKRGGWQAFGCSLLIFLVAIQFTRNWSDLAQVRSATKLTDVLAVYASSILIGILFVALVRQVIKDLKGVASNSE